MSVPVFASVSAPTLASVSLLPRFLLSYSTPQSFAMARRCYSCSSASLTVFAGRHIGTVPARTWFPRLTVSSSPSRYLQTQSSSTQTPTFKSHSLPSRSSLLGSQDPVLNPRVEQQQRHQQSGQEPSAGSTAELEYPSRFRPPPHPPKAETPAASSSPSPASAASEPSTQQQQQQPRKRSRLRPRKAAIFLSPTAVEKLRSLLKSPDPKMIRVGVRNRGCSGLAYHLEYVDKPGKFDEEVVQDGVKVLVDSKALFSIIGSEMDWFEDKLTQKFIFRNPNITEECGCGESFSIS